MFLHNQSTGLPTVCVFFLFPPAYPQAGAEPSILAFPWLATTSVVLTPVCCPLACAASESSILASLWLLESLHDSERSPATSALTAYLERLGAFCPLVGVTRVLSEVSVLSEQHCAQHAWLHCQPCGMFMRCHTSHPADSFIQPCPLSRLLPRHPPSCLPLLLLPCHPPSFLPRLPLPAATGRGHAVAGLACLLLPHARRPGGRTGRHAAPTRLAPAPRPSQRWAGAAVTPGLAASMLMCCTGRDAAHLMQTCACLGPPVHVIPPASLVSPFS